MHGEAAAFYETGAYAQAGDLFARIVAATPGDREAWSFLALCFVRQQRHDRALALIEMRQRQAGDALGLFYDVLLALSRDAGAEFDALARCVPGNSALAILVRFFAGCRAARQDQPEAALHHLHAAAVGAQQCAPLFETEPKLQSIISQGHIFADFAFVDELARQSRDEILRAAPSLEPAIAFAPASPLPPAAPFVFLAACNELYLDRFGAVVVDALERCGIATAFHLHVVDPGPAVAAKIAALQRRCRSIALGLSTERFRHARAGGYRSATYYACSRFLRAGEIATLYDRDLLILDIDVNGLADPQPLVAAMRDHAVGYFDCGDRLPWLICRAALVYVRRSAGATRFNELMFKYIAAKIEQQGFWGLDQAAIYVVTRYLAARHPPFRMAELSAALGIGLDAFLGSESSPEEKRRLRGANTGDRLPAGSALDAPRGAL